MRACTSFLAFACLAALAIVASGCSSSRSCRDNTILLSLTFDSKSMQADTLHVGVTLDGSTKTIDVPRTPNHPSDSLEIALHTYSPGDTVAIAVRASVGSGGAAMDLGQWQASQALAPTCTALSLDLSSANVVGPDGGGGAGGNDGGGRDGGGDTSTDAAPPPPTCPSDKHPCSGLCVPNNDPRTCGGACTPCPTPNGGTASCDGTSCGGTCPADQQLCNGECVPSTMSCASCPSGQHNCSGFCAMDDDEHFCGTACRTCPVPLGAVQATCDGTNCGFVCSVGTHVCNQACAADDDPKACGSSCRVCPNDDHGTPICAGGTCDVTCASGYHDCSGVCVSATDPATCGTSCVACKDPQGGSATCDSGGKCGGACPTGQQLCNGACIAADAACSGSCPMGQHNCNGLCDDNTSVNSCGTTSCMPCSMPTGASAATCDGTKCGVQCGNGYHPCGNGCAANNDATQCGTQCMSCASDPNGVAACQGGACVIMCNNGYHPCGTPATCVSNSDKANCGTTSCSACQVPVGGSVGCDGLACTPTCPGTMQLCNGTCIDQNAACSGSCPMGKHNCSGVCEPNNDVGSCGSRCSACPSPTANGMSSCDGTSCGIACSNMYKNCPNTTLCVLNTGCCIDGDCTGGGAGTVGQCNGNVCNYPCDSTHRTCGQICIPSGNCCLNTDCTAGNMCSSGTCVPVTGCNPNVPTAGCSCSSQGLVVCNATRGGQALVCTTVTGQTGLAWQLVMSCTSTQNCSTTSGGTCQDIAPGAPTIGAVSVNGVKSVLVNWTVPADNGVAIASYEVQDQSGATRATVTGATATSASATGLTAGTSYMFKVRAINSAGTAGPFSALSSAVTAADKPGAPGNVTATLGNGRVVTVAWAAAAANGSPITGYTIREVNAHIANIAAGGTATSANTPSLTPNTSYSFTVTATNALGDGPASAATTAVTPTCTPGMVRTIRASDSVTIEYLTGGGTVAADNNLYAFTNTQFDLTGWMKFDLAGGGVPASAQVTGIVLKIIAQDVNQMGASPTLQVLYSSADGWSRRAAPGPSAVPRTQAVSPTMVSPAATQPPIIHTFTLNATPGATGRDFSPDAADGTLTLGITSVSTAGENLYFGSDLPASQQPFITITTCE
jgi:hypothetical protein